MKNLKNKYLWTAFCAAYFSAGSGGVVAAPGTLADSPLFLSSAVQPNILFVVDDSGSMDWEVLKTNGALAAHGSGSNSGNLDFSPNDSTEDLEHCAGYNAMAYNPATTYTPWAGVDTNGAAYQNQSLSAARWNPYNPSSGTTNLLNADGTGYSAVYGVWVDADSDGVYDAGECPSVSGMNGNGFSSRAPAMINQNDPRWVFVSTLNATERTNYANWYSYYRKREYVAKKALSEIIAKSTSRMGLGTLHDNNSVGTEVKDVDDISLPVNATAQGNKNTLMRQLFRINSTGGTPLRQTLRNAGNYFAGSGGVGDLFGGSTPSSPILPANQGGTCQQNFTILMSDGYWNGGSPSVGNTDADGAGPWDGGAYADSVSDTLADVAMKYYETDLNASLADEVPAIQGVDTNNAQHMVTYTVAFGVNGTLSAGPAPGASSFNWPTPSADNLRTIDDMRHAAYNGRGLFLSAKDPDTLINSLDAAISDIQNREGTAAAVSFNSTSIQANSQVFQASFNSDGWHGNLRAFTIDSDGNTALAWDAGTLLDARNLINSPRQIVTFNGSTGVPFAWPSDYNSLAATDIGGTQVDDLLSNAPFPSNTGVAGEIAANKAFGQSLVAYLRGDAANEGENAGQFRPRKGHRMGDIVHSSPVYVGVPNIPFPDDLEGAGNLYSSFRSAHDQRPGRVYVGANDGMLHVFDADGVSSDGEEVFAYMPGLVFSNASGEGLHSLAENGYNHRYYVDLSPSVADVFVNGAWKTVLVGGLRGGGKGLFALDITDPTKLTEATASVAPMWEFTHNDLGFTFSEIQFGRMANGKWAAIFGNGYNNDPNGDGRAKLFIHYLDGSGTVILDTQAGSMVNNDCSDLGSDCNGLSTPALADLNGDVIVDRVYAGDLQGNMWAFDVSDASSGNWAVAYSDAGSNPMPVFQACTSGTCTSGGKAVNRQPITSKPALTKHPVKNLASTAPNVMVYFGTGQYLTASDNNSTDTQSFYGVWDGGTYGLSPRTTPLGRANLVAQSFTESSPGRRTGTSNTVNYNPADLNAEYGWRIDLPVSKERVVVNPAVVGSIAFFNTLIPSTSSCSGGGDGWLMNVDMLTGGMPGFAVVDFDNDGDFSNEPVVAGSKIGGVPAASRFIISDKNKLLRVTPDSKGNLSAGSVRSGSGIRSRRISWTHLEY